MMLAVARRIPTEPGNFSACARCT